MGVTMNGYSRIDAVANGGLDRYSVAGHQTYLRAGPVAAVLTEVGRRFHAEVEPVVTFNGWRSAALNTASGGITTSNHLSGTAVDINGGRHPRYKHGTFTAAQVAAIRRILADLGGVVRWGGDWGSDVDEMHFEVVGTLGAVTNVANQISTTGTVPTVPTLPVPEPLAPMEDDDMQLILVQSGGALWVGNGIFRRQIQSMDEKADVVYQLQQAGWKVIDRGSVERIDWLGQNATGLPGRVERIEWATADKR